MMLKFKVDGMSCSHCVRSVSHAVRALPGVTDVEVDLDAGLVSVTGGQPAAAITHAIAAAGYAVRSTL
jgi:copper chaperone